MGLHFKNNILRLKKDEDNFIDFCPERGGIVTNWTSRGDDILYFDNNRFLDANQSIRGGIPILFPICGNIDSDFSPFGKSYLNLPQHGFARDMDWEFELNEDNQSLKLYLRDNLFTQKYYPFSFQVIIEVKIKIDCLIFEVQILNKSKIPMPISFGLHPYFNISDFKNIKFSDYPLICMDQTKNSLQLTANYLNVIQEGIDIMMYSSGALSFTDSVLRRKITLINPSPFDISVIWSNPPRKMICLEPWTSPRNSLISGFRKILVPSKSSKILKSLIQINRIED